MYTFWAVIINIWFTITGLAALVLPILKLFNVITLSWGWCLFPLFLYFLPCILLAFLGFVVVPILIGFAIFYGDS